MRAKKLSNSMTQTPSPIEKTSIGNVILLHGLARSSRSMKKLERTLHQEGYNAINIHYDSRKQTIEQLANESIPRALTYCQPNTPLHFVTHSMGGILIRYYLSQHTINQLGHVVMLGPPNHGSEIVDKLKHIPGFKALNGLAGLQLGTNSPLLSQLNAAHYSLGIIAGTRSVNWLLSTLIAKPNDGKVSVTSTKVADMRDHLTLPVTHTFMMHNSHVIQQVLHFLKHGKFAR